MMKDLKGERSSGIVVHLSADFVHFLTKVLFVR